MGNRAGQFVLPFGAGLVAAATGLAGLFLVLAAAIGRRRRDGLEAPADEALSVK